MKIIHEDLFKYQGPEHAILVTTNKMVNTWGKLVMGAGAAKQAAVRFPWLPDKAAVLRDACCIVDVDPLTKTLVGIFPTKNDWRDPSNKDLVHLSAFQLREMAKKLLGVTFHCNFPGIGLGGLKYSEVTKLLEDLAIPDNVWFHIK